MASLQLDRTFRGTPSVPLSITKGIARLTANNPGPMTFTGTNTYLIGVDEVLIVDPGPDSNEHLEAILQAVDGRPVTSVFVSHTHKDHAALAQRLRDVTQAPLVGCAPHSFARAPVDGDVSLEGAIQRDYLPDEVLGDGDRLNVGSMELEVVATPGHTTNHLCLAVTDTPYLLSGDHVMAWSTSIIAPPEGSMGAYLESLQKLLERQESIYLPGHGARVLDAHQHVDALFAHRMEREASVLAALEVDALGVPDLVNLLYEKLDPTLRPAAALSVLAHLEHLEWRGQAERADHYRWQATGKAFDLPD